MYCTNKDCPDFLETGFHAEFVDEVTTCPRCGEYLHTTVEQGSAPAENECASAPSAGSCKDPLEAVFETEDPAEIRAVEQLLTAQAIPNVTRVKSPEADGWRSRGLRLETIQDTVVFLVPRSYADRVWDLLEEFDEAR